MIQYPLREKMALIKHTQIGIGQSDFFSCLTTFRIKNPSLLRKNIPGYGTATQNYKIIVTEVGNVL